MIICICFEDRSMLLCEITNRCYWYDAFSFTHFNRTYTHTITSHLHSTHTFTFALFTFAKCFFLFGNLCVCVWFFISLDLHSFSHTCFAFNFTLNNYIALVTTYLSIAHVFNYYKLSVNCSLALRFWWWWALR